MTHSFLKQTSIEDTDTLIVSFAGYNKMYAGIVRFEFANFLNTHFANTDRHFYMDTKLNLYHQGIAGISNTIDETVAYLKTEIAKYKKVVFIGVSSGGYAAILFGSLLNVTSVLAFIPQTVRIKKDIDEKYRDLREHINGSTKYYIYGDTSITNEKDFHHIRHCEHIAQRPNVILCKKDGIDLRRMRDNGELFSILHNILCS